jgi:hypothetical protein
MLNAEKIENSDYSTNDVADLLLRLQTARAGIDYAITEIYKTEVHDSLILSAYEALVNTLGMIDHNHDCEIKPDSNGFYRCACGLIASAETHNKPIQADGAKPCRECGGRKHHSAQCPHRPMVMPSPRA